MRSGFYASITTISIDYYHVRLYTQLTMATMIPTITTDTPTFFTSKWGRIEIFTGDNYPAFQSTCTSSLFAVGAYQIITGTEPEPSASSVTARKEWIERRRYATQILVGSVAPRFYNRMKLFLETNDLPSLWTDLAKLNRSNNSLYASHKKSEFFTKVYNLETNTIQIKNVQRRERTVPIVKETT